MQRTGLPRAAKRCIFARHQAATTQAATSACHHEGAPHLVVHALARRPLLAQLVAVLRQRARRLLADRRAQQALPLVTRALALVLNVLQLLLQRLHALKAHVRDVD